MASFGGNRFRAEAPPEFFGELLPEPYCFPCRTCVGMVAAMFPLAECRGCGRRYEIEPYFSEANPQFISKWPY